MKQRKRPSMPRSLQIYLWELEQSISDVEQFTSGQTLATYEQNSMLRAAVERKFTVIGEALAQMMRHFPATEQKIEHSRKIVDFRNLLTHEYGEVDDMIVWSIVERHLQPLKRDVLRWKEELE
ncbi:HepT-like ribonuclease domain-containing protein [Edaphobacter dinghuensis]|nr:HepT-like ribonuclease domain-containing protein [Edaphobacter dinghuensis]